MVAAVASAVVGLAVAAQPRHVVTGKIFGTMHGVAMSQLGLAIRAKERHCI